MAEQWFAVYRTDTGQLESVGTVLGALAAGLASVALAGEPDSESQQWDPVGKTFVARPAPSDDDVLRALPVPATASLNPTAAAGKPALLEFMKLCVFEASQFDWFNTKAQADGALTAGQKTAVANLNQQLYVRARSAVAAWWAAS